MALQPWSIAILFNGMAVAWEPATPGPSIEFVLAAITSAVVSLCGYGLILASVRVAWVSTAGLLSRRLLTFVGLLVGYVVLVASSLVLAYIDFPTIPAPRKVERMLEQEFDVQTEQDIISARYTYYGLGDWSEFYRFALPDASHAELVSAAGYRPVRLESASAEELMNLRDSVEDGPLWWSLRFEQDATYYQKRSSSGTVSLLILQNGSDVAHLRRDHF